MKPAGTEVGIYVDLRSTVAIGDVIETRTGRRYFVVDVRRQERGKHTGRQHLRAIVMSEDDDSSFARVHRIQWYKRGRSARAGIVRPPR